MDRLIIAEKAEVANAIAAVLGPAKKERGTIHCGDDTIVYTSGHILELCDPEDYNPEHKNWRLDHLPIINRPWHYKVIEGKESKYQYICSLIKKAKTIIHAGDTDAEGQLLVDEILTHQNVKKPVKRILINDNNPRIVRRSLDQMRNNSEFEGLSNAALARSVADMMYGINMTRLYTTLAAQKGGDGVLSVGRVQTPILGLIVERDRAIERHSKKYYYLLNATFNIAGVKFSGLYQPKETDATDDKNRLTDRSQAETIAGECIDSSATVENADSKQKSEAPPLPYDLLGLQSDAYRKFAIPATTTLELTQKIREKGLITYNRTDCRYLSDEQHQDAPIILEKIANNAPSLAGAARTADSSIKGKAFDSTKVSAHHGIVPAEGDYDISKLSSQEQNVYLLIARQYIAQFWPNKQSTVSTVKVSCNGNLFKGSSTQTNHPGWTRLYKNDADNEDLSEGESDTDTATDLQSIETGQEGGCEGTEIKNKETKPPKRYNQASLLKDLRRVAKYVTDEQIAELLREKDKDSKEEQGGIGTPATRHTFIEKLKNRGFIQDTKGQLISTELGRQFHDTLPPIATRPDMTALWYEQQSQIEQGQMALGAFLDQMEDQVSQHVQQMKASGIDIKASKGPECPKCREGTLKRRKGSNGLFWACKRYPDCKATFPNKRGKPDFAKKQNSQTTTFECRDCSSPLIRRPAKKKGRYWYGCSAFPDCKATYFEKNGKPDYKQAKNTAEAR